ncbi:TonB-dependent receptor plug domain-containing protein [Mucilaginibacter gotjawali]|uniref:TonB-dependent SusC/RagA subfamily outer membrane receptor n=2 Tax=Mucilaginibacter gotjawali TaxID=1550579 RepID=A0A839SKG8_9SPHI|nr:TonB-dependent receptor plug domain-containing protein [Mucilaginibacter gotjawali]MBB3057793.1 TonB-dependent SusC/RagA subfamily outer membrane receptor [Mucilaginibacter gotjawali]BAU52595.1 TonB-dependent Receptor Plug Domain protein [Mucilaginibacter gotjawali]
MKKVALTTMILVAFCQSAVFCQTGNGPLNSVIANLKTLLTDHVSEKAYLHFDRPYAYYRAGEVVFFKAYVTMGERHEPSTISSILHADLIGKNDVLIQTIVLPLTNGTGWGNFVLPDTLKKGNYRVRAYTEWMRNDEHPRFFDQNIAVTAAAGSAESPAQAMKPALQFFPEGGNMVAGEPVRVAFKALGPNGLGMYVKGIVVDNEQKEVARINAVHLGMGAFSFIPVAGKTYQAQVTYADGSQERVDLPVAEEKGIMLTVNMEDPSKMAIRIRANHAYFDENRGKQLSLLLYFAGTLKTYSLKLDAEVLGLEFPARVFPTGILKMTLFSDTGEPLNERLAFIQNPDLLKLSINGDKQVFATRENVKLNLSARDKAGNPVTGSFSVSVVDESKVLVDDDAGNSILSYLLLSAEVKGYIEKPNFYFANNTPESRADLDLLMLTQGYRRFEWKELQNNNSVAVNRFNPEKAINISGVLKTRSGAPFGNAVITLIPREGGSMQTQTTTRDGSFRFANVDLLAGGRFILTMVSPAGKQGKVILDQPQPGPVINPVNAAEIRYDSGADILSPIPGVQKKDIFMVGDVSLAGQQPGRKPNGMARMDNYRSSSLAGPGHANQVIPGEAIRNTPSLSTGLSGLLRGIRFSGGVPSLVTGIVISGSDTRIAGVAINSGVKVDPMLVIVDGANLGNGADIDMISPGSVETIEVLTGANATIYGADGGQGVMIITTRISDTAEKIISKEMSPGIFAIEPKGFVKALEFYSPVYGVGNGADRPDNRTTIFWKPDVLTDTSGNSSFNFFNSDGKGTYRVEVQGMDSNGNLGMQVLRYKVQ